MEQPKMITKAPVVPAAAIAPPDRLGKNRSIYDAGGLEIFGKNFLAGLGRALGGVFVYLLFLGVMSYIFIQTVLPKIMPLVDQYTQALEVISKPKNGDQLDVQKLIDQNVQRYLQQTTTP